MTEHIHPLHTACKKCVFAKYSKKTQYGCDLDYLDLYRNKNTQILEVYDAELEFFVINEKKCPGYRENTWLIKNNIQDASLSQRIEVFKNQSRLGYLLVIDYRLLGDSKETSEYLTSALSSLTIKPQKIVFIRNSTGSEYTKYYSIQELMKKTNIDCVWRIQSMVDESIGHYDVLHSIISLNKPYRFICDIQKLPCSMNKVIESAQSIVYDKLESFKVLADTEYSAILFGGGVYRFSIVESGRDILSDEENYTIIP